MPLHHQQVLKKLSIKMENNEKLKEVSIKNRTCYYFVDKIKFENFYLDNILIDEEPYKNVLVYNI